MMMVTTHDDADGHDDYISVFIMTRTLIVMMMDARDDGW